MLARVHVLAEVALSRTGKINNCFALVLPEEECKLAAAGLIKSRQGRRREHPCTIHKNPTNVH